MSCITFGGRKLILKDLYVRATYQRLEIETLIINEVQSYAKLQECICLDFNALKSNPGDKLYKDLGAINVNETGKWRFYQLHEPEMNTFLNN